MSKGFCYFLPGPGQRNAEQLLPLGVLPLVPGEGVASRASSHPEGGPGALCWFEASGVSWDMDASAQTWRKIPAAASGLAFDYWLGWETAAPPAPEALKRKKRIGGKDVQAAGGLWHVPTPRLLPQVYTLNEDGTQGMGVAPAYRKAYERAENFLRLLYPAVFATESRMDWDELLNDVALMLGLNYRVGRFELLAVGALDTMEAIAVMQVACGSEALEEEAKKNAPAVAKAGPAEAAPGVPGPTAG